MIAAVAVVVAAAALADGVEDVEASATGVDEAVAEEEVVAVSAVVVEAVAAVVVEATTAAASATSRARRSLSTECFPDHFKWPGNTLQYNIVSAEPLDPGSVLKIFPRCRAFLSF